MTEKDNTYKYYAIFCICWMGFFGIIIPVIDEYILNHTIAKFYCDNKLFILQSSYKWCESLK